MVDPGLHLPGGGTPTHGVGEVGLDLSHAFVAVLEHGLVPLGVEHAGAGFQGHLLRERANHAGPGGLVANVNLWVASPFGLAYGAAHTTQGVEVGVHRGHTHLEGLEVLIGEIDMGKGRLQHRGLAAWPAIAAIGKALAACIAVGEFVFVLPAALLNEVIHIGAIGPIGIAKDTQAGGFHIDPALGHVGQGMLANEVLIAGLVGLRSQEGGLGEHANLQWQEVAEDARECDHDIHTWSAQFLKWNKTRASESPEAIEARLGAHECHGLGQWAALGLEVVSAPEHHGNGLWKCMPQVGVLLQKPLGLSLAIDPCESTRHAEGIESMQIATSGQDLGGS